MRTALLLIFGLSVILLCSGQSCSAPVTPGGDGSDEEVAGDHPDDDGSGTADDGSGDDGSDTPTTPTDQNICFSGSFSCSLGPQNIDCGVWQFSVNETNAISGTGVINQGFSESVNVTLGGLFDDTKTTLTVDLSGTSGSGLMALTYAGNDQATAGSFQYTQNPGPDATSVSGSASGNPCTP